MKEKRDRTEKGRKSGKDTFHAGANPHQSPGLEFEGTELRGWGMVVFCTLPSTAAQI